MPTEIQKKYLARAKMAAKFLAFLPFVRMIGLTGSLAAKKANEKSDIDFFVVAKKNRIWTCRFFVTALVELIGLRRKEKKIAGRICLNCYQTEDHLTIGPQNIKNAADYANFLSLYSGPKIDHDFFKANNWIIKRGYRFRNQGQKAKRSLVTQPIRYISESIFELIFADWGEKILRNYQTRKILANPKTSFSSKTQIFISDREIRFHPPQNSKQGVLPPHLKF